MRRGAGKSPDRDRALEILRAGGSITTASVAVGVPARTVKVWARAAGVAFPPSTPEQRASMQRKAKQNRVTWSRIGNRVRAENRAARRIEEGGS